MTTETTSSESAERTEFLTDALRVILDEKGGEASPWRYLRCYHGMRRRVALRQEPTIKYQSTAGPNALASMVQIRCDEIGRRAGRGYVWVEAWTSSHGKLGGLKVWVDGEEEEEEEEEGADSAWEPHDKCDGCPVAKAFTQVAGMNSDLHDRTLAVTNAVVTMVDKTARMETKEEFAGLLNEQYIQGKLIDRFGPTAEKFAAKVLGGGFESKPAMPPPTIAGLPPCPDARDAARISWCIDVMEWAIRDVGTTFMADNKAMTSELFNRLMTGLNAAAKMVDVYIRPVMGAGK